MFGRGAKLDRGTVLLVVAAVVAVVGIALVLFVQLHDDDITKSIFGSTLAVRILLFVTAFFMAIIAVLIFGRADRAESTLSPPDKIVTTVSGPSVLPQAEALKKFEGYFGNCDGLTELCIWGFSLQWASPLVRYIRANACRNLTVRLFVASEHTWSLDVDYGSVSKQALKERLNATAHEWLALVDAHLVRDVHIYEMPLLPNDKGVCLGDKFILLGTYDYAADHKLVFLANRQEDRKFLLCDETNSPALELLKRWCRNRFSCRRYDCKEVTARYRAIGH